MTYFPMLKAPGCNGYVTVSNFPPNNWEDRSRKPRYVHVTWAEGNKWESRLLHKLDFGQFHTIDADSLTGIVPDDSLPLLSLGDGHLPESVDELPVPILPKSQLPGWRATLGLRYANVETSYQGEIIPFPVKASLLTFGSFAQRGPQMHNYMLLVNMTKNATRMSGTLEMRVAESNTVYGETTVFTNAVNIVDIDAYNPSESSLPLFFCREMTGIPLYLTIDTKNTQVSMEHTHPPASLAIHGNRWAVQHKLKEHWFGK